MVPELAERTFDIHAELESSDQNLLCECAALDLTGRITSSDDGWLFVFAPKWGFAEIPLEPIDDGYRASGEIVDDSYPNDTFVTRFTLDDCQVRVFLSALVFAPADADSGGLIDSFSAAGEGLADNSTFAEGICQGTVQRTLTAVADTPPPVLTWQSIALHPLEAASIRASEPLAAAHPSRSKARRVSSLPAKISRFGAFVSFLSCASAVLGYPAQPLLTSRVTPYRFGASSIRCRIRASFRRTASRATRAQRP